MWLSTTDYTQHDPSISLNNISAYFPSFNANKENCEIFLDNYASFYQKTGNEMFHGFYGAAYGKTSYQATSHIMRLLDIRSKKRPLLSSDNSYQSKLKSEN